MRNAELDEAQAGIKIAGRNINNLRYADDTTLKAESAEELLYFLILSFMSCLYVWRESPCEYLHLLELLPF